MRHARELGFKSRILGRHVARTYALESLVICSFLRGVSVRDIEAALEETFEEPVIGKSTVARVCQDTRERYRRSTDAAQRALAAAVERNASFRYVGMGHVTAGDSLLAASAAARARENRRRRAAGGQGLRWQSAPGAGGRGSGVGGTEPDVSRAATAALGLPVAQATGSQ